MNRLIALLLSLSIGVAAVGRAQEEPAPPAAPLVPPARPAKAAPANDNVGMIDFQAAPVSAVLDYYAKLTNRSLIQAPNLAAQIYFRAQTNLTREEMIQALDSVLTLHGIGVVPMGEKFLKVVQIGTAKQEGVPVAEIEAGVPRADSLVTRIIPLKYVEVAEILAAIQPYVHATFGQVIALSKSNSILITDTGGNITQILDIIKYVDQPSPLRMQTKVYVLQHAKATEVTTRLQAIVNEAQQLGSRPSTTAPMPGATPSMPVPGYRPPIRAGSTADETAVEGKVVMTADERTNKIFVLSRETNFPFFDRLIAELDAKVDPDVTMRVVELDYANADEVASLVNALISGSAPTTSSTTRRTTTGTSGATRTPTFTPPPIPAAPGATGAAAAALESAGFLQFAQGVRVLPDQRTNSLLLMATKEDMERLVALIKSVDTSVAQVLVEVVIAEVKLDNELDVGVNLLKRLFSSGSADMFGGTDTGRGPSPIDLTAITPTGAAISGALTYFATFRNLKLDVALRALSTSSRFKVLSTPIIQTLHNQEASIVVGESRPIVTATLSDVSGAVVSNTLSTALRSNVEYKDIAIELTVTPRINPEGFVTMDINQKVNDLGGSVNVGGTESPIITKREAKSYVTAKDQSTIVLGGLIRDDKTVTESKVPFLGDIPFLGHAFKSKDVKKTRTELIVFIRPTVLRTDAQTVAEAKRRAQQLKAGEELELPRRFESAVPGAPAPKLQLAPDPKAPAPVPAPKP